MPLASGGSASGSCTTNPTSPEARPGARANRNPSGTPVIVTNAVASVALITETALARPRLAQSAPRQSARPTWNSPAMNGATR